mmetsp:Transcript_26525/g.39293  ORF Transcript_26525/g.39293 Transcript_26525/m.39293 type:complete len:86 (-) Transcript_26525:330-587(-)
MRSTLSPAALTNGLAHFSVYPSKVVVAEGNISFRAAVTTVSIDAWYSHVLPIPIFVVVVDIAFVTVGKAEGGGDGDGVGAAMIIS